MFSPCVLEFKRRGSNVESHTGEGSGEFDLESIGVTGIESACHSCPHPVPVDMRSSDLPDIKALGARGINVLSEAP